MVNNKIVVIGDHDTVTGFQMAGVKYGYISSSSEETRTMLVKHFRDPTTGLIIMTESLAKPVEDTIIELSEAPIPVILLIPDRIGSTGTYEAVLKELIRRAVGIEINI
ncbi:MAG: V-type ATP synthase subunit F [Candidatus Thorarchaeota archaeon]|nr:V-type ATP synthase subunit F [Candidatus Thorarchaeota archaeon]